VGVDVSFSILERRNITSRLVSPTWLNGIIIRFACNGDDILLLLGKRGNLTVRLLPDRIQAFGRGGEKPPSGFAIRGVVESVIAKSAVLEN
jgi:hypothetical protein